MFTQQELEVFHFHIHPSPEARKIPQDVPAATHDMQEDPAAILDIKEDIREECAKLGEVTNVALFDKESDGIASVRFSNAEAAKACVRVRIPLLFLSKPHPPSHTIV